MQGPYNKQQPITWINEYQVGEKKFVPHGPTDN